MKTSRGKISEYLVLKAIFNSSVAEKCWDSFYLAILINLSLYLNSRHIFLPLFSFFGFEVVEY